MATKTDNVERLAKQYQEALRTRQMELKGIKREGTQIIIPETMTYEKAAEELLRTQKLMDEVIETKFQITCHPHDGLIAFYESMKAIFGGVFGETMQTWFGSIPPQTIQIPISYKETVAVPYGKIKIVGLDIEWMVGPNFDEKDPMEGSIYISAKHRRMLEPQVLDVEKAVKARLKKDSIFKGKAVNSKMDFIDTDYDISRIVYSRDEWNTLNANLFYLVTHTGDVKKHHVSLRKTLLLYGQYGTGKTLTARRAMKIAVDNGWTFMNVLPGGDIVPALKFGRKMQPCVVFYEDIDQDTSGKRDVDLNKILNELDGVLSKDAQVIVILTTNDITRMDRAMLRPGRIDLTYEVGRLDADAVEQLVRTYGGDNISDVLNKHALFDAAREYPPAFVVGATEKAMDYALADPDRNGGKVILDTDALVGALKELRPQYELMMGEKIQDTPTLDASFTGVVNKTVKELVKPSFEKIYERLDIEDGDEDD